MNTFFNRIPKSTFLLLSISIFVFILPLIELPEIVELLNVVAYSLILVSIFSIINKKTQFLKYLLIISVILIWFMFFSDYALIKYIAFSFSIIVFIIAVIIMIMQIVLSKTVTTKVIIETICGYLLIGVVLGFLNSIFLWINPDALNIDSYNMSDIIYYSFITVTTIGYGDILPVSEAAKSLSILFGIISQLYLTIIMALIIGKFLNNTEK